MYGTVARIRAQPGTEAQLQARSGEFQGQIDGLVHTYIYRAENEPDTYWMAVIFTDKAAYVRNAQSPAQDARYQKMRALLAADPAWHDGAIVYPHA
jgi:quinol monooxygenase YgiN